MVKRNSRLIRFGAALAIENLIAIVGDQDATPTARVAAARALLELDGGKLAQGPRAPVAPRPIEKVVKVNWADSTA